MKITVQEQPDIIVLTSGWLDEVHHFNYHNFRDVDHLGECNDCVRQRDDFYEEMELDSYEDCY